MSFFLSFFLSFCDHFLKNDIFTQDNRGEANGNQGELKGVKENQRESRGSQEESRGVKRCQEEQEELRIY